MEMTSSYERSQEIDLESQEASVQLEPEIPAPKNCLRFAALVIRAGHIFFSKANDYKKVDALASPGVLLLTPTHKKLEAAEIEEISPIRQVSITVPASIAEVSDAASGHSGVQPENIAKMVKERNLNSLHEMGGIRGIAEHLKTDLEKGITGDHEDLSRRRRANAVYKTQAPSASNFFVLLMKSSNNFTIFLLFVAAVLSLSFGIKEEGWRTGWYEGVVILLAIIILVIVPPVRELLYQKSENLLGEMEVQVLRSGKLMKVSAPDLVRGDIVSLERGCPIPGDGLFVSGEHLELDESSPSNIVNTQNPFLSYGAKVINGKCNMLVTSMGLNTTWGEMMRRASKRRLPVQLGKLSTRMQIIGLSTSILILVVLFLRFELGKKNEDSGMPEIRGEWKTKMVMDLVTRIVWKPSGNISALTTSLTTFLVGMVEGVPFVTSLAIYYWNKKILSTKAVMKEQLTGVTMGSVTTICIDKSSGWLKYWNRKEVECWIGEKVIGEYSAIPEQVEDAIRVGIIMHSSTEDLLMSWGAQNFKMDRETLTQNYTVMGTKGLSSGEEGSGVLVRNNRGNDTRKFLHWKGLAPTILKMCSRYFDSEGKPLDMDGEKRLAFEKIIEDMKSKDLKTIALAYKTTDVEAPEDDDLILIGLLGLEDSYWTETKKAVKACRNGCVNIILVSQDKGSELEDIAEKYGMTIGSKRLEQGGETFRSFNDEQRMDVVNKICVMGNSSPSDKLLLVRCLKKKGHIVAFVGAGTDDAPVLKEADVGIVTETESSEAEGNSDLIILDGNLGFLASILKSGRCICDNIQKYIQVQVTITISGILITTVTTTFFGYAPVTGIQMIWVNLIVAILGGLALLTEPPSHKLMKKPPIGPTEPFISKAMWRNIIIQVSYQVSVLLAFQFKGNAILNVNEEISKAMIFNSFLICQLFNLINASEQKVKNAIKGVQQNLLFWVASVLAVVFQAAFIEIAHQIFGFAKLKGPQWGICFLIGALSCVTDWAVNMIWGAVNSKLTRSSSHAGFLLLQSANNTLDQHLLIG